MGAVLFSAARVVTAELGTLHLFKSFPHHRTKQRQISFVWTFLRLVRNPNNGLRQFLAATAQ
jgi:hypothetical protein